MTAVFAPLLWCVIIHCVSQKNAPTLTRYSSILYIHASVIQGSALGPASYIITAFLFLHPVHDRNRIFKFADDTYLIVPDVNTDTCQDEIQHLQTWAADNNLKLNEDKTKEIVIMASRKQAPPPPRPDVERVSRLRVSES